MQKWKKAAAGGIVLLGVAIAVWFVFQKEEEFQDESTVDFITKLFTVEFVESEKLFQAIDKEIEEALEKNDEKIVTFSSKAIENTAMDKFGRYVTSDSFDTLLDTGALTAMFERAYMNQSDYKISDIKKQQETKQEDGYEVSYIVEFGQYKRASNVQQAWWSTEVTVEVVKEENEWKIADIEMEQDNFEQLY